MFNEDLFKKICERYDVELTLNDHKGIILENAPHNISEGDISNIISKNFGNLTIYVSNDTYCMNIHGNSSCDVQYKNIANNSSSDLVLAA